MARAKSRPDPSGQRLDCLVALKRAVRAYLRLGGSLSALQSVIAQAIVEYEEAQRG